MITAFNQLTLSQEANTTIIVHSEYGVQWHYSNLPRLYNLYLFLEKKHKTIYTHGSTNVCGLQWMDGWIKSDF